MGFLWGQMHLKVLAPCNPLTLQPEQSGGMGSIPNSKTPPLEHHDKGLRTQLVLNY